MMRHVKRTGALLGCALLLVSCTSKPPKSLVTPLPQAKPVQQTNEPMRGISAGDRLPSRLASRFIGEWP